MPMWRKRLKLEERNRGNCSTHPNDISTRQREDPTLRAAIEQATAQGPSELQFRLLDDVLY